MGLTATGHNRLKKMLPASLKSILPMRVILCQAHSHNVTILPFGRRLQRNVHGRRVGWSPLYSELMDMTLIVIQQPDGFPDLSMAIDADTGFHCRCRVHGRDEKVPLILGEKIFFVDEDNVGIFRLGPGDDQLIHRNVVGTPGENRLKIAIADFFRHPVGSCWLDDFGDPLANSVNHVDLLLLNLHIFVGSRYAVALCTSHDTTIAVASQVHTRTPTGAIPYEFPQVVPTTETTEHASMAKAARAVNIRREPHDTYVGRPRRNDRRIGSARIEKLRSLALNETASNAALDEPISGVGKWGNPWSWQDAPDPIGNYRRYIRYRVAVGHVTPNDIRRELAGKRLGCFCKPKPCHADVLADLANSIFIPLALTPDTGQVPLI